MTIKWGIENFNNLDTDMELYRYMSLDKFKRIIESQQISVSRIAAVWDDTWELPISQIPRLDENGKRLFSNKFMSNSIFGICFTTNNYSDAMWRIYSPDKNGIMITTTVNEVIKLKFPYRGYLGKVVYYGDTILDKIQDFESKKIQFHVFDAYLKRNAFKHEEEIRLTFLTGYSKENFIKDDDKFVNIDIEINNFIKSITLDPRISEKEFNEIKDYCIQNNILVDVKKSELYDRNAEEKLGISLQWKTL